MLEEAGVGGEEVQEEDSEQGEEEGLAEGVEVSEDEEEEGLAEVEVEDSEDEGEAGEDLVAGVVSPQEGEVLVEGSGAGAAPNPIRCLIRATLQIQLLPEDLHPSPPHRAAALFSVDLKQYLVTMMWYVILLVTMMWYVILLVTMMWYAPGSLSPFSAAGLSRS